MKLKNLLALPLVLGVAFPVSLTSTALTVGGIAVIASMSGCGASTRQDTRQETRVESRSEDRYENRRGDD